MIYARDIIYSALGIVGATALGETPSAEEAQDGVKRLNSMLKSWNIDGAMVFRVDREAFPLTGGDAMKTLGEACDFDTVRPNKILQATALVNGTEYPIEIINDDQWAAIANKLETSSFPEQMYVQPETDHLNLYFYKVPSSSSELVLYTQKQIIAPLTLNSEVILPDGWQEALEYNLAVRLSGIYGKQLDPMAYEIANESKNAIKRQNTKPVYMSTDAPTKCSTFDIYSGRKFN